MITRSSPTLPIRNPDKHGSEEIGTRTPTISEERSRELRPGYYLALPWHFLDEFLDCGEQFIVPVPEVHPVSGMPDVRVKPRIPDGQLVPHASS